MITQKYVQIENRVGKNQPRGRKYGNREETRAGFAGMYNFTDLKVVAIL